MPVTFIAGDLFTHPGLEAIAHGCNCAGAMGKGIALESKRRWPDMYHEYRNRCLNDRFHPGDLFVWQAVDITIFNLGTQKSWKTKAEPEAIRQSLSAMIAMATTMGIATIGLPRIGAGLGGLKWDDVKAIIIELAEEPGVELIVFEVFP